MELELVKWLLLGFTLIAQIHGSKGWIEEERVSLLQIKASIPIYQENNDGEEYLPSWVYDPNSDYCEWEGVTCNSTASHVIHLSLYNIRRMQAYNYTNIDKFGYDCVMYETKWFLNFSIFWQFEKLISLNLSYNGIKGEGLERLSRLNKLEVLDHNCLYSESLSSMTALTSLKALFLNSNFMQGSIPTKDLAKLKILETLDLSYNGFKSSLLNVGELVGLRVLRLQRNYIFNSLNGILPLQTFSTFTNLEILDLARNDLSGSVPENMWAPSSLKALSLFQNNLNGSLLGFCEMTRLEELDLRFNSFGGNLPMCLQNLTSLRYLDLSWNQFTGHIPSNILGSLKLLEYIDLSGNLFEGLFSFKIFANNSRLEMLVLDCDNNMKVESKYPGWVPSFQLKHLFLQKCGLGDIPEFFLHQFRLAILDLSHNKIETRFPNCLIENNTGLVYLSLENNSFNGQIQGIGEKIFPNMKYLNLAKNSIEGYFPFSPSEDCELETLDLSFNKFTGEIPEKLLSTCTSLVTLKLDNNKFHGQVFTSRFNLTGLISLELNDNQFVGTLSLSALSTKFSALRRFNLRNICFNGEIPSGIINNTRMQILDLSHNFFDGEISCELLSAAHLSLDLSHNYFSGSLPSCFKRPDIDALNINLESNKLSGSLPELFLNLSTLMTLNMRDNNLSGRIPERIVAFQDLQILLLGGNHFNGIIPNWLCELNYLSLLDLSRNYFTGSIPQCLGNLSILSLRSKVIQKGFELSTFPFQGNVYSYKASLLGTGLMLYYSIVDIDVEVEVEFVTKNMTLSYKGDILNYMSGLDLSQNNLTGEIPYDLAHLSQIRALNLSHNQLAGSIPGSFSKFYQLESLDLSHNRLSGEIPPDLITLYSLAVFSVAYNNLSGRTPERKYQFGTFDKSSFEGNPLLCGTLVEKRCSSDNNESNSSTTPLLNESSEKWYEIDLLAFYASFGVSFLMFFLGVIIVLYICPNWRHKLFYHAEKFVFSFYYFLYDNVFKFFICMYR